MPQNDSFRDFMRTPSAKARHKTNKTLTLRFEVDCNHKASALKLRFMDNGRHGMPLRRPKKRV